jgi:hypothetical protein
LAHAFRLLHFKGEGFESSQVVALFIFGKGIGGIFAQSKNRGARETAVANERLSNNIRL